jgi:hypothetical protein
MDTHTSEKHEDKPAPVQRVAMTPAEFGALFGKSVTWAYRRIYAGQVRVIPGFRPRLIPNAEVERFLKRASRFTGK